VIHLTFRRNCLVYVLVANAWPAAGGSAVVLDASTYERTGEIRVYRLFTRGLRSAFASKTSSPNTSRWLEFASQVAIFIGPVGAILLGDGSRWGFVLGLATQPFWFYTSFRHRQWGIFIASIFYASGWAIGVYRNF
jgi:hypothetical protein